MTFTTNSAFSDDTLGMAIGRVPIMMALNVRNDGTPRPQNCHRITREYLHEDGGLPRPPGQASYFGSSVIGFAAFANLSTIRSASFEFCGHPRPSCDAIHAIRTEGRAHSLLPSRKTGMREVSARTQDRDALRFQLELGRHLLLAAVRFNTFFGDG
jgi:hypothetical protein